MSKKHEPSLNYMFERFNKNAQMQSYIRRQPQLFDQLIQNSLSVTVNNAWRCTMLVGHLTKKNDSRLIHFKDEYINLLPKVNHDGHQRQILIILDKMKLTEDQGGHLFNHCMTIWEAINKIPSTRIRAFWILLKIAKNYPELKEELLHFTTAYYTETLSPGIKISFQRAVDNELR